MTQPIEPREAEAMAVTLGRIDVKVGNILDVIKEVRVEVTQHRGKIGKLELDMQQVQSDQATAAKDLLTADKAREDTAAALEKQNALALAKAKDAVDSEARQSAQSNAKSTSTWSKRQTLAAIGGFVLAVIVGIFGIVWAIKTGSPPPSVITP
jgi:hypothetical protein